MYHRLSNIYSNGRVYSVYASYILDYYLAYAQYTHWLLI